MNYNMFEIDCKIFAFSFFEGSPYLIYSSKLYVFISANLLISLQLFTANNSINLFRSQLYKQLS